MKPTCKIFFWLALGVFTVLTACDKDEPTLETSVEGYVLDATTGKGIVNAKVYLNNYNYSVINFNSCDAPFIDSVLTPANGYYTFNFIARKGCSYQVDAEKYPEYSNIQPEGVVAGTLKNYINLLMNPLGYIRIFVKNVPPANESDSIFFDGSWGGGGASERFYGKDVDTSILRVVWGNKFCDISWFFSWKKPRIDYDDTIYVSSFDTTNYYLNY